MKKIKIEPSVLVKILNLHFEMKDIVLDSGVQEGQYNFAIKNLHKESEEFRIKFLEWLLNFKDKEYKIVKNTLSQFSQWHIYKELHITNMPEQTLLKNRQKILREAWHKRLRPPKKDSKKHGKLQNMSTFNSEQKSS